MTVMEGKKVNGDNVAGCGGGGDLQLGGQHGGHQSWGTNWSDNLKKAVC